MIYAQKSGVKEYSIKIFASLQLENITEAMKCFHIKRIEQEKLTTTLAYQLLLENA